MSKIKKFLFLWLILSFSYAFVKTLFNLVVFGWIDVRPVAFWEILFLPLGQGLVLWFGYRLDNRF